MAKYEEFCEVWEMLRKVYPDPARDGDVEKVAGMLHAYYQFLKDLDDGTLKAAAARHVAISNFFPKVAELRKLAIDKITVNHPSAEEAWAHARLAMKKFGYRRKPVFADSAIGKAVNAMGWQSLCSSDNEVADRAHFFRIYDSIVDRENERARELPEVRAFLDRRRPSSGDLRPLGGFLPKSITGGPADV